MKATTKLRLALAAAVLPALTVLAGTAPAHAAPEHPCADALSRCGFYEFSDRDAGPDEHGMGTDARGLISINTPDGTGNYQLEFNAYGETVELEDNFTDGQRAEVWIQYYGPGGPYYYHYFTGSERTIDLGSDGDLTEDRRIKLWLCIEDYACTMVIKGWT